MNKRHLLVVSVDALVYEDLEFARTLPVFGELLREGSLIKRVHTIYPALTHPIHASIITGCPAGLTGVTSNEIFQAGVSVRPWFNYMDQLKVGNIFEAAHKAGYTTASCRWPMTALGGKYIDYLVPEIMNTDFAGHEDDPAGVYRAMGTTECLMDVVENAIEKFGYVNAHPTYDAFQIYCAAEIIRRYKPDILFTHPGFVDAERHRTGLFTEYVTESVRVTEEWLEELVSALKDAGIYDDTDIVVLSDHGHLSITRTICPNVFLRDKGYIRVDGNEDLESWDAFVGSCGCSAHVYLSRPDDEALKSEVYTLLKAMAEEKIYGFEEVLTADEARERYDLYGDFSFVLETDGFTSFNEDWRRPVVRPLDVLDYRFGRTTHGHMPEKGPQPPFIAMGPSFKKGVVVENGDILNHAPTFAKLLGVELPQAIGHAETAIIKDELL